MPLSFATLADAIPDISSAVEFRRLDAARQATADHKAALGQFLTPASVAELMASMLECKSPHVRILDPGAGVGSLFAAVVSQLCARENVKPLGVEVTAYEIDDQLERYLHDTVRLCERACEDRGIEFSAHVRREDFLEAAVGELAGPLFDTTAERFNCAILNPPYYKIRSNSRTRSLLRNIGIETSNVYTGFVAAAVCMLESGGELVAITPRSFCNGPYFHHFRRFFLREMTLTQIHVFESRDEAFQDDAVLQENVVFHALKHAPKGTIRITCSRGAEDDNSTSREVPYDQVVQPGDPQSFIRIVTDDLGDRITEQAQSFNCSLAELGISVSTGRVVDFRATDALRPNPSNDTVPLIYPTHFADGSISWPKEGKKPNAIVSSRQTSDLLVPNANYVLVKRFSAKEERRRIVAAVYEGRQFECECVGFENHLNYYHADGDGLNLRLAKGLAAFLNSTVVDYYFRQFSGHTQVNATDLRNMRYPTREQLLRLGARVGDTIPEQDTLDELLQKELFAMANSPVDPVRAMKRMGQAQAALVAVGLPKAQCNERSALTLLALLDLPPQRRWSAASAPLQGITPMMEFFAQHYGKRYASNSRETVRRQTVHQFLDAGLIVANPDEPSRAINSGKTVYQIEASALELFRTFGGKSWTKNLRTYLASVETLKKRYAQEREMVRVPVEVAPGKTITLSPGGQNVLVKQVMEEFAPRFTPGGKLIYVGDTDAKFAYFDAALLQGLGVTVETHGKMPDVIIHHTKQNWLVLIEAVTSHGPVNAKRHAELRRLFKDCRAGLVFVTAFLDRKAMVEYLNDISWETEVWGADAPSHLIHFNGERFLGPY